MRENQANVAPNAITTAYEDLSAGLKADVDAQITDGSVTIFNKNG